MKKLLYITNGITGVGGLERVLAIKANYLADKYGYEVHILTLNEVGNIPFYTFNPAIKLHNISASGNLLQYIYQYRREICRVVKSIKPDIISVCDDGLKGFFLPILLGKPCLMVYERHASVKLNFHVSEKKSSYSLKNIFIHFLMRMGGRFFDKFVVLTDGVLKEWKLNNMVVIPNPLSFDPIETASLNSKKVIAVGSHSYNKGYDLLLSSWSIVIQEFPGWSLEIYGKVDMDRTFVKLSETLGINHSVFFFEPVLNIKDKYLESSIMVLSSRSEGFGMVLIEAMACGVPCISFDCPNGPAYIINDVEDGFLVVPNDIHAFAERIKILMGDKKRRKQMGKNAKENVKRYLPDKVINQWNDLFKSISR